LIGSLGNVRPAKNYEILIEAASIINKNRKQEAFHFLIAGHQRVDLMQKLNVLSERLNVTPMIHFLGFLDDTPKFLSQLDIFLLCSSSEGFSIATIEAMATGLPVIATRCGGPEEIITSGINGILVENNNPKVIAEAIRLLIDNKNHSTMLFTAGKKHVLLTFSLEVMINRYVMAYKNLLERNNSIST
jgi:glycosyltransferase involved in cell wall biosynthesis